MLIRKARKLYAEAPLGVDLTNAVYALDASTIDLCLSLFEWAPFRSTKAAIKLHTLLDLRGNIPSFIHISDGELHDVNKQHLRIKRFFGNSEHAVKTQIWCAITTCVLIAIVKNELQLFNSMPLSTPACRFSRSHCSGNYGSHAPFSLT